MPASVVLVLEVETGPVPPDQPEFQGPDGCLMTEFRVESVNERQSGFLEDVQFRPAGKTCRPETRLTGYQDRINSASSTPK